MDIRAVKQRLAEIQKTIPGVKRAYDRAPASLPPSDLPVFVNFMGRSNRVVAGGEAQVSREILMRLYVGPITQGQVEASVEPFFGAVADVFDAHPGLGLGRREAGPLAEIQSAMLTGDSGVVVLSFAGQEYLGIEFRLQVESSSEVSYALYE